jgi:succinyl-CoA synthetase alpha subunit
MKIFRVLPGEYRDSLFLMKMSTDVSHWPGVKQAVIVMGTESNRKILDQVGLNSRDLDQVTANDLVIAVEVDDQIDASDLHKDLESLLKKPQHLSGDSKSHQNLEIALKNNRDADLVTISTPGEVAVLQARNAIEAGKHVFCFSHHISIEAEIELKDLAIRKGLLMMGPDCGTSIIDGVGLGFANQVQEGSIGIISASGSGLQEVVSLIHRSGSGISQAIGVGGRDLSSPVDGRMTERAVRRVADLPQTKVILLLAKKISSDAQKCLTKILNDIEQPIVVQFRGFKLDAGKNWGNKTILVANTYEECTNLAVRLSGGQWSIPDGNDRAARWISGVYPKLEPSRYLLRGLFAGGSLCGEAYQVLSESGFLVITNLDGPLELDSQIHSMVDLGAEEFTEGRAHPFIDHSLRTMEIEKAFADPNVGIILADIVLGWGCHNNPAGELVDAIAYARGRFGIGPAVITSVCGTNEDIQNYDQQRKLLEENGIFVAESNAAAAHMARDLLAQIMKPLTTPEQIPTSKSEPLIKDHMKIINVGLPIFEQGPIKAGANVVPVRWQPGQSISENARSLLDGLI